MLKKVETLTDTETAILSAFERAGAPDPLARRAADTLREHGLPTRRVEAWHYTDLRNRLKSFGNPSGLPDAGQVGQWLRDTPQLVASVRLPFLDGHYIEAASGVLPDGIEAGEVSRVGFRDATDAVAVLNAMFARDGLALRVAAGARIDAPIELLHGRSRPGVAALCHEITVETGASATFIERHVGPDDLELQNGVVTGLKVGEGASVVWIIDQEDGEAATHLAQLNVALGANAELAILAINAGGRLVRREINVTSDGEGSDLVIRGVNLIGGDSHLDVTTSLVHVSPATVSSETFRNVATGRGAGAFQGEIRVARAAQKTDARMACNTLLLSDEAEFFAKPELEIFADDVQCGHGATVTDILDDHLFYLRSRGIPEREARSLLVMAFVEEVFDEVENEEIRAALNGRIEDWLDRHG